VDGLIDDDRWLPFPIEYCGRVMFDAIRFSVGGMVVAIWTLALAIQDGFVAHYATITVANFGVYINKFHSNLSTQNSNYRLMF